MDGMEQNQDLSPEIDESRVAAPTEASLRLHLTDLLLGELGDARTGRSTREHSDVLRQIEAALETYESYFYHSSVPLTGWSQQGSPFATGQTKRPSLRREELPKS
jgi:hypothetical protein